jgi:hypothetical protein
MVLVGRTDTLSDTGLDGHKRKRPCRRIGAVQSQDTPQRKGHGQPGSGPPEPPPLPSRRKCHSLFSNVATCRLPLQPSAMRSVREACQRLWPAKAECRPSGTRRRSRRFPWRGARAQLRRLQRDEDRECSVDHFDGALTSAICRTVWRLITAAANRHDYAAHSTAFNAAAT